MDFCSFIINIIELCCSLVSSILSYWSVISGSTSLWSPLEQTWMVALDSITSMCWILYALYRYPLSWFLIAANIPPLILQLLCFTTSIYYQLRGSRFPCPALHAKIALGTAPLISTVVSLLWSFDLVSRICFAIFAILAGTSSSILTIVQLWSDPIFGDWKTILRSTLGLVGGAVELLMGIQQHNILFLIDSVTVLIFGLVQLGVAFLIHENNREQWFSHGNSNSLPSQSAELSQI